MFNKRRYILLVFIFCACLSYVPVFGQTPSNFTNGYFLFIDHENQSPVLILDDSTIYRGYNFEKSKLQNLPKDIPLKDLKAIKLKNQTYIVDRGCGPVFKFSENGFKRLDHSFRHHNQFNASTFVFNESIHFFGGYGLFTDKNIVTYFDESLGEWLELSIKSPKKPKPRSNCNSLFLSNKLYIWGGSVKDDTIFSKDMDDATLWVLDLKGRNWEKLGVAKKLFSVNTNSNFAFQKGDNLFIFSKDAFYKIDVVGNQITHYEFSMPNVSSCVYDPYSDKVILINKNSGNDGKNIYVERLDELTKTVISRASFYNSNVRYLLWIVAVLIALIVVFFVRKVMIGMTNNDKEIVFDKKNDSFKLKQKPIVFDNDLHRLFVYLIDNQNKFILLDSINELFVNSGDEQESYITINKRRDIAVKKLVFNLKTLLNKGEREILIERKHAKDRRIKEIKLGIVVKIIG